MVGFHNVLKMEEFACPSECSACMQACSQRGDGHGLPVIKTLQKPEAKLHGVATCYQCQQPKCLEACPADAITKSPEDGVVRINEEACISCGSCVDACSYGQIYLDKETDKVSKCDHCDGKPRCVEACPHGVISYLKPSEVVKYLGEDKVSHGVYMCQGCAAEAGFRFTQRVVDKVTGQPAIYFGTSGCMALILMTAGPGRSFLGSSLYYARMTNVASSMTGIRCHFRRAGKDVPLIAFAGDGCTADIGFQSLSGAAERGEKIVYICYDNQGYMNTGIQKSGATPFGAWTTTTPVGGDSRGKRTPAKNVPLVMAYHGVSYVATASMAFLDDYAEKLAKALKVKDGFAYIHLIAPCTTGWRYPMSKTVEVGRLAVETNLFPLWEAENGKFRLTYRPKKVKPITEYTKLQGRFAHLKPEELDVLQTEANEGFARIERLTKLETL